MRNMCSVIMQVPIPKPSNYLHNYSECNINSSKLRGISSTTHRRPPPPCSLQRRRSGGYPPAIWDFHYIQALNTEYKVRQIYTYICVCVCACACEREYTYIK